jgi:hypothetical protein
MSGFGGGGTISDRSSIPAVRRAAGPRGRRTRRVGKASAAGPHRDRANEQCWMNTEINKVWDLNKRAKLVDKCVADKAQAI